MKKWDKFQPILYTKYQKVWQNPRNRMSNVYRAATVLFLHKIRQTKHPIRQLLPAATKLNWTEENNMTRGKCGGDMKHTWCTHILSKDGLNLHVQNWVTKSICQLIPFFRKILHNLKYLEHSKWKRNLFKLKYLSWVKRVMNSSKFDTFYSINLS